MRNSNILGILGLFGFVLLQFQNCAPANMSAMDQNGGLNSGIVSVIDNVHKGTQISFTQNQVSIPPSLNNLQVQGNCDSGQSGAVLAWRVVDDSSQIVASGNATCELSNFSVYLSALSQLPCGRAFELQAQFGFDPGGQVTLIRQCQN